MKMKYLSIFMMLVLAFSTIITFNSCSKDDSEDEDIVGAWKIQYSGEEGYDMITFHSDGTGVYVEYNSKGKPSDSEPIRYSVSKDGKTLKIIYSDGESEVYHIEWINKDKITLLDSDGDYFIMIRQ